MSGLFGAVRRNWHIVNAEPVQKSGAPLKLGLIGASSIAPHAIIHPARTHADIVIYAVAARDIGRARIFAAKHGIPVVKSSYQDLLDDPKIDCVYISVPNSLHHEWALRALKAGKHVLLEKPGANNSSEAEIVFRHPLLTPYALHVDPGTQVAVPRRESSSDLLVGGGDLSVTPVLLEAMHVLFHPAWSTFMDYVDPRNVASAKVAVYIPKVFFSTDSNKFNFDLGGGALMDLGGYTASSLLRIFGQVAVDCTRCETEQSVLDQRCDRQFRTRYRFPNGGVGEMEGYLRAPIDKMKPVVTVVHRPVVVPANTAAAAAGAAGVEYPIPAGCEIVRVRKIKFNHFLMPTFMHSIEIDDEYTLQQIGSTSRRGSAAPANSNNNNEGLTSSSTRSSTGSGGTARRLGSSGSISIRGSGRGDSVVKRWKKSQTVRAYTFEEAGKGQRGDPSWTTYRYQLEQFVNKVRGRNPGQWFSAQDSLDVMRMLDMAYVTAGLPLRPTSDFTLHV
ncbi:hypothetical protein Micbo1qcDRAFT_582 [Microdochium bolleyi]|uniref:D-xylose 1-dehydrogenase (NADP(+), D-xylono-1,5-lactone-forming) n=1 Tax=Microdochium bolleyi TaxID=196109 RepID=A0A136JGX0_9PEZI|nr:hypothetical protein Micbo1qcDRAFT_582 [Microdochium bolleyi]